VREQSDLSGKNDECLIRDGRRFDAAKREDAFSPFISRTAKRAFGLVEHLGTSLISMSA